MSFDEINGPALPKGAMVEGSAHATELSKLKAERERLLRIIAGDPSLKKRDEAKLMLEKKERDIAVHEKLLKERLYEQQREGVAAALRTPPVVVSSELQRAQMEAAVKRNKEDYDALPPEEKLMYKGPQK